LHGSAPSSIRGSRLPNGGRHLTVPALQRIGWRERKGSAAIRAHFGVVGDLLSIPLFCLDKGVGPTRAWSVLLLGVVAQATVSGAGHALDTTAAANKPVCLRGSLAGSQIPVWVPTGPGSWVQPAPGVQSHRGEFRAVENGLVSGYGSDAPLAPLRPGLPLGRRGLGGAGCALVPAAGHWSGLVGTLAGHWKLELHCGARSASGIFGACGLCSV